MSDQSKLRDEYEKKRDAIKDEFIKFYMENIIIYNNTEFFLEGYDAGYKARDEEANAQFIAEMDNGKRAQQLFKQNQKLREALQFYAATSNIPLTDIFIEYERQGTCYEIFQKYTHIAREALKDTEEK